MYEIIDSIIKDLYLDINKEQEAHIENGLELMIEVMEKLRSDYVATDSWTERQIIMSHIVVSQLIPEVRAPLFERAEYALSKAGV